VGSPRNQQRKNNPTKTQKKTKLLQYAKRKVGEEKHLYFKEKKKLFSAETFGLMHRGKRAKLQKSSRRKPHGFLDEGRNAPMGKKPSKSRVSKKPTWVQSVFRMHQKEIPDEKPGLRTGCRDLTKKGKGKN